MDISFKPDNNSTSISVLDVTIENGDLKMGDSLATAVVMSLFCDARSVTNATGGWWGDALANYQYGSQLWTLRGRKLTSENLALIKKYAENALQWIISDGVASSVSVSVVREGIDRVSLAVTIQRPGGMSKSYKFYKIWSEK